MNWLFLMSSSSPRSFWFSLSSSSSSSSSSSEAWIQTESTSSWGYSTFWAYFEKPSGDFSHSGEFARGFFRFLSGVPSLESSLWSSFLNFS